MSNSFGFLAYALSAKEPPARTNVRVTHVERHLSRLYSVRLRRTEVGDSATGLVGWVPEDHNVQWKPLTQRGDDAVAWLHIPGAASGPDSGVNEWELAQEVLSGATPPHELGAPFAVVGWSGGRLTIVNDVLGLARIFHFSFSGGDVWTTRPGMAHIFMGETPTKNRLAWAGMATLGWATSGTTHLGDGQQLPGYTRVEARHTDDKTVVSSAAQFGDWLGIARSSAPPSAAENVQDMEHYMSTAKRWPRTPTADLSGGKDSRVVTAIGLRSGAINRIRTIATDHGEVETARTLLGLTTEPIEHHIEPRKDPSRPGGNFVHRLSSQHHAWEGRYLATTAFNSTQFAAFRTPSFPIFNGLGGEAMAGGNLLGAWRDRLINAPPSRALDKMATMANVSLGASQEAKDLTIEASETYIDAADSYGIHDAAGVMDIFYNLDKMPNWTIIYGSQNIITPLFARSLLSNLAQRIGRPLESGEAHRILLKEAMPPWANIPFYKPTAAKRATPFMWESSEWPTVKEFVTENIESVPTYDPAVAARVFRAIDASEGTKREEIFLQRLVWELTFVDYLEHLATEAGETAYWLTEFDRLEHLGHHS